MYNVDKISTHKNTRTQIKKTKNNSWQETATQTDRGVHFQTLVSGQSEAGARGSTDREASYKLREIEMMQIVISLSLYCSQS